MKNLIGAMKLTGTMNLTSFDEAKAIELAEKFSDILSKFHGFMDEHQAVAILAAMGFLASAIAYRKWRNRSPNRSERRRLGKLRRRTKSRAEGFVFGKDAFGNVICSPSKNEGSVMVASASGSGKTTSILINSARAWKGTFFCIDISGDITSEVVRHDKKVYDVTNPNSIKLDLLALVDRAPRYGEKCEQLKQICLRLIEQNPKETGNSAFFKKDALNMLYCGMVAYYFADYDFPDIMKKIYFLTYDELIADVMDSGNETAIALAKPYADRKNTTKAETKDELNKFIEIFALNDGLRATLERGSKSISAMSLEANSVFLKIPDESLERLAPLVRLVTGQTFDYLATRPIGAKPHIALFLDEFASYGKLDVLPALRKLRKRNVRVMVLTQGLLPDLDLTYSRDERNAMLANFDFIVCLGLNAMEDMSYMSSRCGYKTVTRETVTRQYDKSGEKPQFSESESTERVPLFQPEDFSRDALEKHVILVHPYGRALRLRKNFSFHDKSYAQRTEKQIERERLAEISRRRREINKKVRRGELIKYINDDNEIRCVTPEEAKRLINEAAEAKKRQENAEWAEIMRYLKEREMEGQTMNREPNADKPKPPIRLQKKIEAD